MFNANRAKENVNKHFWNDIWSVESNSVVKTTCLEGKFTENDLHHHTIF